MQELIISFTQYTLWLGSGIPQLPSSANSLTLSLSSIRHKMFPLLKLKIIKQASIQQHENHTPTTKRKSNNTQNVWKRHQAEFRNLPLQNTSLSHQSRQEVVTSEVTWSLTGVKRWRMGTRQGEGEEEEESKTKLLIKPLQAWGWTPIMLQQQVKVFSSLDYTKLGDMFTVCIV